MSKHYLYGLALVVLGIAGYVLTNAESPTALIPSAFGVLVLGFAFLARAPGKRWPYVVLLVLALLAIGGSATALRELPAALEGEGERPAATISRSIMCALSVLYLLAWIFGRKAKKK